MGTPKADKEHTESPWAFGMRHRLALALEVSGTSVHEMAEVLEVSPNTVGNYTSGRTTPKHATIAMWAMKTGAPIGWIKTGVDATENPHQSPNGGQSVGPAVLETATSTVKTLDNNVARVDFVAGKRIA